MLVLHSDHMLTCPLDESHRIRKERMQFHLVKCAKNHTLDKKMKCPWNPLHIIDKFQWKNHWMVECENMPAAVEFLCQTDEPRNIRTVPIDTTKIVFEGGEDWDAEPFTGSTYDPVKNAENKPVLRVQIGLSKAKKKVWRQAERKRIQDLEANGPLQNDKLYNRSQAEKSVKISGPLRQPHNKGVALSADDSMISDLNSSKPSVTSEKRTSIKEIAKLRKPHTPSPAMSMKAESTKPKIVNDEAFSVDEVSIASGGTTNLENSRYPNSDAASMISGISCTSSRRANLELFRQEFTKNITVVEETDDDITQRLANLTTMEKSIKDEKAVLLQHMTKFVPKLVNPKSSKGSSIFENGSDRAASNGELSSIPALIPGKPGNFTRPLGKCAAGFPALKEPPHSSSAERGAMIDFAVFEKRSLGKKKIVENTSRNDAASVSSEEEICSVFDYEELKD